jgi:glutamate-1-semialdehyde aminotransferase/acyl carrier protein
MSTSALASSPSSVTAASGDGRRARFVVALRKLIDDVAGVEIGDEENAVTFLELGLDSLALTQVALQIQKAFSVKVTFRQLMETYPSLEILAEHMDKTTPPEAVPATPPASPAAAPPPTTVVVSGAATSPLAAVPAAGLFVPNRGAAAPGSFVQAVVDQQLAIMAQQLALLSGARLAMPAAVPAVAPVPVEAAAPQVGAAPAATPAAAPASPASAPPASEEEAAGMIKYDVKKAFGAIARIHHVHEGLTPQQKARLDAFIRRYTARTKKSKEYTEANRAALADPRVVNGFRPALKEIIYQVIIERSKGARMWDLDGNEYVDVLSGFGMNMFGWQPQFIVDAVKKQLDLGYEIGPQHPLAAEVARGICELTGFDRAALCNTGSEAVMGTMRIARTVTGRTTIAIFTGAYHGIFDEVIVRGTKKLRAVPAAPGIMPSSAQNVLVLDYGTPESMEIIKARAGELAAVLVEPVQSRRPDFQPREFLAELREVTERAGTVYIWDEVVTGFRAHQGGAQAHFGIKADLASYGKVIGGGFPIGVIAGRKPFMDALDGGSWQFGDDSTPTVGVTYFAGTFVRHPLALAACKAAIDHLREGGPALQEQLNARAAAMAAELNSFFESVGAPLVIKQFASLFRTAFTEDHPYQDLLFAMLRDRGVHLLDNFPCFLTTAHTPADIAFIVKSFKAAVTEMQEAGFLPPAKSATRQYDAAQPPVAGARLGKDPDGKPAWFVPNPAEPGKYMRLA